MSFLKAEWRKLALANYSIDPSILQSYLPYGTELDLWNNTCYVSLVGFMFKNTRLLGIPIPFHTDFEEVNLRFYVRYKEQSEWKRGVVFIKEIVPKWAITFVANTLYKEHYQTLRMKHLWQEHNTHRIVSYQWKHREQWQKFKVKADLSLSPIPVGSDAEFITEHYWGYTKINAQKTFEYEVRHPSWKQYAIQDYYINVDYGQVYGADFSFLTDATPTSVMLAEGSEISVENKKRVL